MGDSHSSIKNGHSAQASAPARLHPAPPHIARLKQSVGWDWKVCTQQPALEVRINEIWIVRAAESLQPTAALRKRFASAMIDQQIPELTVEIAAGKGCEYRPHLSGSQKLEA